MREFKVTGKLTYRDVETVNSLVNKGTDVLLVLQNTKDQDSLVFNGLNNNRVKIRIIGGLDEKTKPKYNSSQYYERTMYSPLEVAGIIAEFEKLEKGIQDDWSDLEKAVYIYDKLASSIKYDNIKSDRDMVRTLNAITTKKAVCAGYSLIYKEAMDRLEIECEYISKPHTHAWNAIKIDSKYYPLDLTWEAYDRQQGKQNALKYFASDPSFSENKNHQPDESDTKVPSRCLPKEKLESAYRTVNGQNKTINKCKMARNDKTSCYFSQIGKTNDGLFIYAHSELDSNNKPGKVSILYSELDLNNVKDLSDEHKSHIANVLLSKGRVDLKVKQEHGYVGTSIFKENEYKKVAYTNRRVPPQSTYTRKDGTSFVVIPKIENNKFDVNAYILVELHNNSNSIECKNHIIYSETNLVCEKSSQERATIADVLLSQDRIKQKVDNVGGYVGFVDQLNGRLTKFYDARKEQLIGNYSR